MDLYLHKTVDLNHSTVPPYINVLGDQILHFSFNFFLLFFNISRKLLLSHGSESLDFFKSCQWLTNDFLITKNSKRILINVKFDL